MQARLQGLCPRFTLGIAILALAGNGWAQEADPVSTTTAIDSSKPSGYLWGALIRATDKELEPGKKALEPDLTFRLGEAYSYSQFHLIGEHTQPVLAEYEAWVLPSEELYMKVDSKGPVEHGLGLHLQLWRRENVIVKTDVILNPGSPVFVTGPKWGDDQLVFVILLKEEQDG